MHLPFKAHTDACTPNVCGNNVYEAQMRTFILTGKPSTDKYTG